VPALSGEQCDYKALAAALNSAGWQQFAFIKSEDHSTVLDGAGHVKLTADGRWIVVTHSCDLVHHTDQEPFVEILGLERAQEVSSDDLAKQSPRLRYVAAYEDGDSSPLWFIARASTRISILRERLRVLSPDNAISLRSAQDNDGLRGKSEHGLSEWLAGRYNRSWAPTEFDKRLSRNIAKIQPSLTRLRGFGVEDVFARVTPGKELDSGEQYEIDLVILVNPAEQANLDAIKIEADTLARHVTQKDRIAMVSPPYVELSTRCGYGYVQGWMRFHDVLRDSMSSRA
jgi:hypothetical protein